MQLCVKYCGTVTVDKDIIIKTFLLIFMWLASGQCLALTAVWLKVQQNDKLCSILTIHNYNYTTIHYTTTITKFVEVCTVSLWRCDFKCHTAFRWHTALIQLFRSHKQLSTWMWMSIQQQAKDSNLLTSDEIKCILIVQYAFCN